MNEAEVNQDSQVQASYTLEKQDVEAMLRYLYSQSKSWPFVVAWLLGIICLVLAISTGYNHFVLKEISITRPFIFAVLTMVILSIAWQNRTPSVRAQNMVKNKRFGPTLQLIVQPMLCTFNDEAVTLVSQAAETKYRWEGLFGIGKTETHLFVMPAQNNVLAIPLRALSEDKLEKLVQIFEAQIPKRFVDHAAGETVRWNALSETAQSQLLSAVKPYEPAKPTKPSCQRCWNQFKDSQLRPVFIAFRLLDHKRYCPDCRRRRSVMLFALYCLGILFFGLWVIQKI